MQKAVEKDKAPATEEQTIEQVLNIIQGDGTGKVTLSNGMECIIRKCTVRSSGTVIWFIENVVDEIVSIIKLRSQEDAELKNSGLEELSSAESITTLMTRGSTKEFLKLISKHFDHTVKVLSSLTDMSEELFFDMELDDAVLVIRGIYEVNARFFTQKVLPQLKR